MYRHGDRHPDSGPANQLCHDLIPQSDLATHVGIVDALRQSVPESPSSRPVNAGGVTSLFVRGGNSTANKVLIDGITANDVGGIFDFGTVSSTGLTGLELYRGPNSALYGTDAGASVVNLETPRGSSLRPVLELLRRRRQLLHLPQRGRPLRRLEP